MSRISPSPQPSPQRGEGKPESFPRPACGERVRVRGGAFIVVLALLFSLAAYAEGVSSLTTTYVDEIPGTRGGLEPLPPMPQGPLLLTSVTPEMLTPDYWISRLPQPDKFIKTPGELQEFNRGAAYMVKELVDIFALSATRTGKPIHNQIELEYTTVKGRILFDVDGERVPKTFFEERIRPLVSWEKVPDQIKYRWGVATTGAASVRALPTEVKVLEEIGDIEFDQLQFTTLKLWTPVAILHESSDGKWYYVQAPYVRGWVRAKLIALFKTRDEIKELLRTRPFLVVTGESIPIFFGPDFQYVNQIASMGTILPLAEKGNFGYVIWMPRRGSKDGNALLQKAYLPVNADVSEGFLPYTQRNVIRQAFKLLGARYGWGGMYYGRDCSGFTQDVFFTMGLNMPRTSKGQVFMGTQIDHFEPMQDYERKIAAIQQATPGITLFKMPLHQMLYLGRVGPHFYVIHSTWAERVGQDKTLDEKRRINQVVVSDLSLNGNSYLGSLFDRMIAVSEIQ